MKIRSIIRGMAACLVFATTAFAGKPEKDILGKWTDAAGVENIEYKADGTFTETITGGEMISGRFSFPDANHIKVEFAASMTDAVPIISPITIKGDEMDITGRDGVTVLHYKRQK